MVLSILTPYTLPSEHPGTVVAGAAPGLIRPRHRDTE